MDMKVNVDVTNLDLFMDLVRLMKEMTDDLRVEESVREEYKQKLLSLSKKIY